MPSTQRSLPALGLYEDVVEVSIDRNDYLESNAIGFNQPKVDSQEAPWLPLMFT